MENGNGDSDGCDGIRDIMVFVIAMVMAMTTVCVMEMVCDGDGGDDDADRECVCGDSVGDSYGNNCNTGHCRDCRNYRLWTTTGIERGQKPRGSVAPQQRQCELPRLLRFQQYLLAWRTLSWRNRV